MRVASRALQKELKAAIQEKSFKKAVKSRIAQGKELMFANVGLLRPKNNWWTWTKAYWKNYGTLANRDPSHKFSEPRKRGSAKWKGGIRPAHFYEKAERGKEEVWKKNFLKELNRRAKERAMLDGK